MTRGSKTTYKNLDGTVPDQGIGALFKWQVTDRLAGRRSCEHCGATYHVRYNRPKVDGVCDRCGSELRQRPDDVEAVIAQRLKAYREQTAPLVARYRKTGRLVEVDGRGRPDEVFGRIAAVVTGLAA